ncbi:MBL fold metallo-hydrolase [Lutibacter sp. B2]|nr:MBL fold metallo-hydrolase [Lutibacter sp. B2]
MDIIFSLLTFFSLTLLTIGIVNPSTVIKWKKKRTRKDVFQFYGCAFIGFYIISTYLVPFNQPEVLTSKIQNISSISQSISIKSKLAAPFNNIKDKYLSDHQSENVFSHTVENTPSPKGIVKVHYIDVGQGDCILVENNQHYMLIDAGNNDDSKLVLDYLKKQGIKKLDVVVGTHPHEDHIGSLDAVINNFDIGKVYMPKIINTTKTYRDVITAIKSKELRITPPKVGERFRIGDATASILAPNSEKYKDLNNYSIVIKLTYGSTSYLFTGDAEGLSEKEMLGRGSDLSADVLKVGHHGSHSSSIIEFLNRVNPKYAVISCEKNNDYKHPHKETMDKLEKRNIPVYRTDESGTIICTSDGQTINFNTSPGSYTYPR